MKLRLQFGLAEPKREVNWWQGIEDFHRLVIYKARKWEFVMYDKDQYGQVDYICIFSEVIPSDPTYNMSGYITIDYMFDTGYSGSGSCVCGSAYSSFNFDHMRYCPKWTPW